MNDPEIYKKLYPTKTLIAKKEPSQTQEVASKEITPFWFTFVPNTTDKIIYARLGRLMPERRREEINFRGRGKIRGYQIKMNEHVVSYDTKKTDIDKIIVYDSIVKQIMDTFNEWKNDREKRINHKNMLNTVHSQIIKYFEETM